MPSKKPQLILRADSARVERWKEAATASGMSSLNTWACLALDDAAGGARRASGARRESAPEVTPVPKKGKRARTDLCEHRVPPTAYCGRCD